MFHNIPSRVLGCAARWTPPIDFSRRQNMLQYRLNNIGDPNEEHSTMHTKDQQRALLDYFRGLWNLRDDATGYVTSGSTEAIFDAFDEAISRHGRGIVCYSSSAAHYCVGKIARKLGIKHVKIKTDVNDQLNLGDFVQKLDPHSPALFIATVGTTMKCAVDPISEIKGLLKGQRHYIHVDGAFLGSVVPFIEPQAMPVGCYDSISTSGHKFWGVPMPCGIVLFQETARKHEYIDYIKGHDSTHLSSRLGHTPYYWREIIKGMSDTERFNEISSMIGRAKFVAEQINARRSYNCVWFPKPSDYICQNYGLATEGRIGHIYVMPGMDREVLDQFIGDFQDFINERDVENEEVGVAPVGKEII